MSIEIELKLAMRPEQANAVLDHPDVAAALRDPIASKRLVSTYFDTPSLELRERGVALRLRDKGGRWVQTLKTAGTADHGLFVRRELECSVPGPAIELERIDDVALRGWLGALRAPLQEVFVTDFVRDLAVLELEGGTVVELCIDRGELRAAGRREAISEVELELVRGEVEPLGRFAARLRDEFGLVPDNRSKAARGYRLFAAR